MHAVVSPAFSHARLTLDWLASSRASSIITAAQVCLCLAWYVLGQVVPRHKDVVIIEPPGSQRELARRRRAVCHQRR
jgi:hypothetical protein